MRILLSVMVRLTSMIRGLSTVVQLSAADGVRRCSVVNLDNLQLLPRA